jgi:hypothetical protein
MISGRRPCAVIKTVFKSAHVMVTTIVRVHAKMVFAAISFNPGLICTFKHRHRVFYFSFLNFMRSNVTIDLILLWVRSQSPRSE